MNVSSCIQKIQKLFEANHSIKEIVWQSTSQRMELKGSKWKVTACEIFDENQDIADFARLLAQDNLSRLDTRHPFQGGTFTKRYRWHASIPPASSVAALQVRRMDWSVDLNSFQNLSEIHLTKIRTCILDDVPLIIFGETGSGKSTFLHGMCKSLFLDKRVVFLETISELPMTSPLWLGLRCRESDVSGKGSISMRNLFNQSLRLRPDKIVIGELRESEATFFEQVALSGHGCSLTTMHAGNERQARERLTSLGFSAKGGKVALVHLRRGEPPTFESISIFHQKLS